MYKLKEGPNNRGIELNSHDLQLLHYLYEHKFLKNYHMKKYMDMYRRYSVGGFNTRVKKYRDSKLIKQLDNDKISNIKGYKSYRITKKGIRCLRESGLIDKFPSSYSTNLGSNKDHHFITQDIILHFLLSGYSNNVPVQSLSAYKEHHYQEAKIIPDRIIRLKDYIFNIEIDTGTESHGRLEEKLYRYIEFANTRKEESHIVLFVLSDQYYESEKDYPKDRTNRIRNMKETFSAAEYDSCNNIDFYVLSYQEAITKIPQFVEGVFPISLQKRLEEIELAVSWINKRDFEFKFKLAEKNLIQEVLLDEILYEMSRKENNTTHYDLWICLDQGSVKSYKRVKELLEDNNKMGCIIGLYDSWQELENDVLPLNSTHIKLTTTEKILSSEGVPFFKAIKGNRRERVTYETIAN